MTLTDQDLAAAEAAGRLAAREGLSYRSCPFQANGDADQRTLTAAFLGAFLDAGGDFPTPDYDTDDGDDADPPSTAGGDGQVYPWVP